MTQVDLKDVDHRSFPIPKDRPWLNEQVWDDLLFAHWPIAPEVMRQHVPPQFELDLWDGQAWLGVVPFYISTFRGRWLPKIPGLAQFGEINVRTYVKVNGVPGVYFFSLDAANILAVIGARTVFRLPYFQSNISIKPDGEWFAYNSQRSRGKAEFIGRYRPVGEPYNAVRGSHDYFLTERYCLFTLNGRGEVCRADIHHKAWPLQAAELDASVNSMAAASGFQLQGKPLLHFSKRQEVLIWGLVKV